MDKKAFGKYIKKQREMLGLTQQGLADLLFIDATTLSSWERGRTYPDIEMIRKLCEIFSTSIDEAMVETDKIEEETNILKSRPVVNVVAVCILAVVLVAGAGFGISRWNKARFAANDREETSEVEMETETDAVAEDETTTAIGETEIWMEDNTQYLTWECTDGVLTISGTGEVPRTSDRVAADYDDSDNVICEYKYPAWHDCGATKAVIDCYGVEDMSYFLAECYLAEVEFGDNFDTSETTNIRGFFYGNGYLTSLSLEKFDTSKVTDMSWMFEFCVFLHNLEGIDWDTSHVTNMRGMFWNCENLTDLDLSSWNVPNVSDFSGMFYSCYNLRELNVAAWDMGSANESTQMVSNCYSLEKVDCNKENIDAWKTIFTEDGFSNPTWETTEATDGSNVLNAKYIGEKVYAYEKCTDEQLTYEFENGVLTISGTGDAERHDGEGGYSTFRPWSWCDPEKVILNCSGMTDMSGFLYGMSSVKEVEFGPDFDSSDVWNFFDMFAGCSSLTTLDGSAINTSSAQNMCRMFAYCSSLTELSTNGWNTAKVKDFYSMFDGCSSLTALDLNHWNVSSTVDFYCMFSDCTSLQSLKIDQWEVTNGWNFTYMFSNCTALTDMNLTGWKEPTANSGDIIFAYDMFDSCAVSEENYPSWYETYKDNWKDGGVPTNYAKD